MYGTIRLTAITLLLFLAATPSTMAGVAEDQYAVAAHHYANARWAMAVDEFTGFLRDYPDHERADAVVFYVAESLVQLKRYQEAHERYVDYLGRCPEGPYARQGQFRLGETLYLDGRSQQARHDLEAFTEQYPDDALCAYAYPYLGEIALEAKEPQAAQEAFERGLQKFPNGPLAQDCRFGLARSLESLGDSDGAIRFYEFLGGSEERTGVSEDALLQLAILLYRDKRFDEAIVALQRHRDRYPGSEMAANVAYWLGLSQAAQGHYKSAAETLSGAANRFPSHELAPAMLFATGEAYRGVQDFALARRYYQRVLDQYSDSTWADDSLQILVQLAWDDGDLAAVSELADRFDHEFATSPLLTLVRQTAARACLKQAEYDRAIELLEPCLAGEGAGESEQQGVPRNPDTAEPETAPLPSMLAHRAAPPASLAATRYYLALALLGAKRHQEALEQLDALVDLREPQELISGVQVARASALLGMERFEQAVTSLHLYLTSAPDGPDAEKCRAQLAVTCARLGRWSEVRRVFTQMQHLHRDRDLYLSSLEYMAEAAYGKGERGLAEQIFHELAADGNPAQYVARGISGLAWLDWTGVGGAAGSARRFEQLLKRYPDSPLAAEAAMMRGQALEKTDHLEGAVAMYRLVMQRYSDSVHVSTATLAAARIYDTLQRDGEAEPLLRQWLAEHPAATQRPDALYQLAWVLMDLGKEEEADQIFRQIHEQCRSSRYWSDAAYRLAERAARAKDYVRAEELASEIIEQAQEPQMVAYSLYLRGQLAAARQRWKDVVDPLQQLLAEYPDSDNRLPAEYWLAEAYFRQRQYDAAGKWFARLDEQTRELTDQWVAMIPLRHAQVLAHDHQWDEAFEAVSQIPIRFPHFSQQHEVDYLIGRYHASRAEFDQAREAYLRVIRSSTGRVSETAAVAQWMIGETYFMQKQYNQAIKAYFRVEGLYDYPRWKAAALLQAGKCHEMVGRWTEAVDLYSRVVNEYAETSVAEKATRRLRVAQQRATLMKTR